MRANPFARLRAALPGCVLLAWCAGAGAEMTLNMTQGVTPISHEVYDLHMLIFWICVVIGLVVFGVMFFSMYYHRKSRGVVAAQFHESTTVELIWTVVPMLILISIAIPATKTLIAMEDSSDPDLTVTVTGYQWKWKYDYLDEGISFFSSLSTPRDQIENLAPKDAEYLLQVDRPLVLPVGKKIRILTTAADVIHSWWVPDLGWKRDAIPGFINANWVRIDKPGTYRGQCAELCGKDHGFMPIVVVAKTEEEFGQWLAEQKSEQDAEAAGADREWSLTELVAKGEDVFRANCVACHQANGEGIPGAFPPLVAGKTFAGAEDATQRLRERGFLNEQNQIVLTPVKDHLALVMSGVPGTAMAAFGDQLSDVELAAVVTYERNAWGNDTGDAVQPLAVKALR